MRKYNVYVLLTALLSAFTVCGAKDEKPNILIICADDLAPLLGAYNHPIVKSPKIDEFAKDAVVFEEAHCNVSICTASRTSILTGVRPSTSGLYGLNHDFKKEMPDNVSLPMHFRKNGYFTQTVGKIADKRGGDWRDQRDKFHCGGDLRNSSFLSLPGQGILKLSLAAVVL